MAATASWMKLPSSSSSDLQSSTARWKSGRMPAAATARWSTVEPRIAKAAKRRESDYTGGILVRAAVFERLDCVNPPHPSYRTKHDSEPDRKRHLRADRGAGRSVMGRTDPAFA